jgi:uncharacterized membrane protein
MSPTIFGLTLAAALGSALVAGVLFAFSVSVMDALDRVPPGQAINAMNQINETIVLYLVGVFVLTMVHHVPLNDHLANVDPNSAAAASEWRHYFDSWVPWNHVRTVAPLASTGLFAVALTL